MPKVGDTVKILRMQGKPEYTNKIGKILVIDSAGQLHGTWGQIPLIPIIDSFKII